ADEAPCAKTILSTLSRRAYRGNTTPENVRVLLDFYQKDRADGGTFDSGIEFAIRRMLVSPEFLYRVEADPVSRVAPGTAPIKNASGSPNNYRISDNELASRL